MDALNVVLGDELRLQRGDVVVTGEVIRGRRIRLVLAYIVLERRHPILVPDLVRAVWSEEPPASWPSSIREIVSRVRALLTTVGCAGAVSTRDRSLHIALPDDIHVDVEQALAGARRLREAAATGARHTAAGEDLAACAAKVLDATSAPFLGGEESPWVHGWRVRLRQAMVVALTTLAEAALARGDAASAAELADRMIGEEPTTEVGHALLMRSQQLGGQRAEALWTYDRYRRLLADQLGVDPPASLQALHLDLLQDQDHRPAASPAPSVATVARPRLPLCSSVPQDLPFVGRKGVMNAIAEALAADRHGGIVLVRGEPGSGKTRLLAELVERAFLPAGPVLYGWCEPGAADPGGAIWQALGDYDVAPPGGPAEIQETVRRLIGLGGGQTVTLLLDDLQWADELTVRFVSKLVRQRFRGSVAVVAAYSSTEPGRCLHDLVADLHRAARPRLVDLEPLGPAAVQALVCRMVGRGQAGVPTTAHLLEESGGNAGYLAELLIAHAGGNVTGAPAAISARVVPMLEALDRTALALVRAAAVAGPLFRLSEAAEAAGLARADVWLRAADELILRGWLATVEAAPGHLRFRHGVVRRVVLESMGPLTREQLRTRQALHAAVTPPAIGQHRPNDRPARQTYRQWHCGEMLRSR